MEELSATPEGVSIHAGFPNPAADTSLRSLDLNQLLVRHSASTYFFRIRGSEWEDAGIFDGDIAIIDRAVAIRKTDTVIWWNQNANEFNISGCKKVPSDATVWGVITAAIHQFRTVTAKGKDLGR